MTISTSARRLFDDEDQQLDDDLENAKILLPAFVEEVSRYGMICDFLKFMELVTKNLFPLTNIALQLFLAVVHLYSCNSTTEMHYSEATKQFWLVGYRLFHGSFIRFMSGDKNEYGVLTAQGTLGNFSPQNSQINFAVPSIQNLIYDYWTSQSGLPSAYRALCPCFQRKTGITFSKHHFAH